MTSEDGSNDVMDADDNRSEGDDAAEADSESSCDAETDEQTSNDADLQVHQLSPEQPTTAEAERASGWSLLKALLIRTLFIYLVSSLLRRGGQQTPAEKKTSNVTVGTFNIFERGTIMDLYIYLSEDETFTNFAGNSPFWVERNLTYGDWTGGPNGDGSYSNSGSVIASQALQNNGSLYIHVYLVRSGHSPDPSDSSRYSVQDMVYRSRQINKFMKKHASRKKKLIFNSDANQEDEVSEVISHWHPNLTINIIVDHTNWIRGEVPAPMDEFVEFIPETDRYYPVIYINDYWNMNADYVPINSSTRELQLSLTFAPLTMLRWQVYTAQRMRSQLYAFLGETAEEQTEEQQDSLKRMFLETNPYLLGITIVVTVLHSVFEFLALKNDVQFWHSRTSLAGLSVRSVFYGTFQSIVMLLYVFDNESSPVVRITVSVGVAVELWKTLKAIDLSIDRENKFLGVLPWFKISDKASYVDSQTKHYDTVAFWYASWILVPLFSAYALYSIFYLEHRGWYSWLINVLFGFLLTFSFVGMTPQLFINYKLKSVAHLPWRTLTYKALNTFIDDLFAFVLRTPLLFRIGCFRDDIIFLIYLYQRWIYNVDPKRTDDGHVAPDTSGDREDVDQDDESASEQPSLTDESEAVNVAE